MDSKNPVPESIERAVEILNNPWDHIEMFPINLLDTKFGNDDPDNRIRAKAEWLTFKQRWALYVEWDDSEPLTARSVVHRTISNLGLQGFVATGCASNYDEDSEDKQKFPGTGVQVSYLKVTPTERNLRYTCSECGESNGKINSNIDIQLSLN